MFFFVTMFISPRTCFFPTCSRVRNARSLIGAISVPWLQALKTIYGTRYLPCATLPGKCSERSGVRHLWTPERSLHFPDSSGTWQVSSFAEPLAAKSRFIRLIGARVPHICRTALVYTLVCFVAAGVGVEEGLEVKRRDVVGRCLLRRRCTSLFQGCSRAVIRCTGRARRSSKFDGSGRVWSGRARKSSKAHASGRGRVRWFDPTRPDSTRPDPTRPDPTREKNGLLSVCINR